MAGFTGLSGGPQGLQLVDLVLSGLARQYRPHGFLYDMIVAPQPVNVNHGKYPVFELAKFFNATGQAQVADDAGTPIVDAAYSTAPYQCEDYRLRTRITRKERLQAHEALKLDTSKTTMLLGLMALEREQRLAKELRSFENGGALTAKPQNVSGKKWDAGKEGDPANIQKDLLAARNTVYKQTGIRPNTLVITERVAEAISQDPTIQNLIKYLVGADFVASGNISGNSPLMQVGDSAVLPKKLFGLQLLIADGVLVNTTPGGATASLAEVWGNSARVLYVNKAAAWGQPTIAYSFKGRVTGDPTDQEPASITDEEPGGTGNWAVVDRWTEADPPAENIRAWECVDENVTAPEAGIEIQEVLATP